MGKLPKFTPLHALVLLATLGFSFAISSLIVSLLTRQDPSSEKIPGDPSLKAPSIKFNPNDLILVSDTQLKVGETVYACAIGRSGVRQNKTEGDGATPTGRFSLRQIFYRPDRLSSDLIHQIKGPVPIAPLKKTDGWCNDPNCSDYNKSVQLPFSGSHEKLWHDDTVYDLIVVVGYNDQPAQPGKGSAIFIHIARPGYTPTEGCIALKQSDLEKLLLNLKPNSNLIIPECLEK